MTAEQVKKMTVQTIKKMQAQYGLTEAQNNIDSGITWKMAGSSGRYSMDLLKSGACLLPKKAHCDYFGNKVPSRDELEVGTTGTFQNSVRFWSEPENYLDHFMHDDDE